MKPFIICILFLCGLKLASQTQPTRLIEMDSGPHSITWTIHCDGNQVVSVDTSLDGQYLGTDYALPLPPTGLNVQLPTVISTDPLQFRALNASVDPSQVPTGESNAVVTIWKSIQISPTASTPFKPTAFFPASRTNTTLLVLPGVYFFRATITMDPMGESNPSDTNNITIQ